MEEIRTKPVAPPRKGRKKRQQSRDDEEMQKKIPLTPTKQASPTENAEHTFSADAMTTKQKPPRPQPPSKYSNSRSFSKISASAPQTPSRYDAKHNVLKESKSSPDTALAKHYYNSDSGSTAEDTGGHRKKRHESLQEVETQEPGSSPTIINSRGNAGGVYLNVAPKAPQGKGATGSLKRTKKTFQISPTEHRDGSMIPSRLANSRVKLQDVSKQPAPSAGTRRSASDSSSPTKRDATALSSNKKTGHKLTTAQSVLPQMHQEQSHPFTKQNSTPDSRQSSGYAKRPVRPAPPCPRKLKNKNYTNVTSQNISGGGPSTLDYMYVDPSKIRYPLPMRPSQNVDGLVDLKMERYQIDEKLSSEEDSSPMIDDDDPPYVMDIFSPPRPPGTTKSNIYTSLDPKTIREGIYTVPNQQQTGEALSLNSASQDKSKDSRQRSHEEVQRSHEEKYTAFDDLKPQKPSAPSSAVYMNVKVKPMGKSESFTLDTSSSSLTSSPPNPLSDEEVESPQMENNYVAISMDTLEDPSIYQVLA